MFRRHEGHGGEEREGDPSTKNMRCDADNGVIKMLSQNVRRSEHMAFDQ